MVPLVVLLALVLCAFPSRAAGQESELAWLAHDELQLRLRELARLHPERARYEVIGRSRASRDIGCLRLCAGEPPPAQPAIWLVANIEGPQVYSSAAALHLCESLLARAESDEKVRRFLDTTTLYVVPRAHPDAAEARFGAPRMEVRATGHGVDDDRDGRLGEDGPADVDGDGVIAWMRVPDGEGTWMEDPRDPRVLVEAKAGAGEQGRFRLVREGFDEDGDEEASEDQRFDAELNRNFPHAWREHAPRFGLFPTDEPEARALADFFLRHKDIALVVVWGELDNVNEKPKTVSVDAPRVMRVPPDGWLEPDAEILSELAKRRAKTTQNKTKGDKDHDGSLQAWVYQHGGVMALSVCLWDIPLETKDAPKAGPEGAANAQPESQATEADKPPMKEPGKEPGKDSAKEPEREPSADAKRLTWLAANDELARYVEFKPFEHPQLGTIGIGGWQPYARTEPPSGEQRSLAEKERDYLLELGESLARIEWTEVEARELGGGLIEAKAVLTNPRLLPVELRAARRADAVRPVRVRLILPAGAQLVAGSQEQLVGDLEGMGSKAARRELRWLVHGAPRGGIGIEALSDHAGTARAELEVQR